MWSRIVIVVVVVVAVVGEGLDEVGGREALSRRFGGGLANRSLA